jgi:putative spermidine/putrescine transport system permease protein
MNEAEEDLPPGVVSTPPPRSSISGRGRRWVWLGVVPFFLYTFAFLLYPAISILLGAFQDENGKITTKLVSSLFEHGSLEAYWTSIKLSVITAVLGGLFGLLIAHAAIAGRLPRWVRTTLTTFSGVAANFAGVPLAFAFIATIGFTGIITKFLNDRLGFDLYGTGFKLYSFWGLVIVYLYFQIPLMVLVIAPAIDGLRREWREAAENLGATATQYWRHVALPVLMPSLLGAGILLFGSAFGAYATAYALTSGRLPLVPLLIGNVTTGNVLSDPHYGNALALGMVLVLGVTMTLYAILQRKASRWQR